MKVLKFGGTSVANANNIKLVKNIIIEEVKNNQLVVVTSAFGGVTDLLIKATDLASLQDSAFRDTLEVIEEKHISVIKALFPIGAQSDILGYIKKSLNILETLLEGAFLIGESTSKLSDKITSFGELLSSYIIGSYFKNQGMDAIYKDIRSIIITDETYGNANVDFKATNTNCEHYFGTVTYQIVIVPGFISASKNGNSTTLGRGGSDYTAAIIAAAIEAEQLEIWTDVSGMYTANPKLVKQATPIAEISYEEAMELSHFGAKVLYPPTIQPVYHKHIPIYIKNTFSPVETGTRISKNVNGNKKPVRGISHIGNIGLLSLEGPGMIGIPGVSKRMFEVLSVSKISIVFITQASSEHSICIGIQENDLEKAATAINEAFEHEIHTGKLNSCSVENNMAIIALVGDNMKSHQGLSGKMFSALGKNNVNIRAIAQGASEKNISAVIKKENVKKALNILHEAFFEDHIKQLNLFVMGVGNVGSRFLNQIRKQRKYLKKELQLNIRVIALSNSRKMFFAEDGLDLNDWENALNQGEKADGSSFYKKAMELNYRNSIFVDNTASDHIANAYSGYLKNSISVVTCNKIACSSNYDSYRNLKNLARKYNAPFLFETNVGAGLPIIDTIKNLIASGDRIHKIQAVLSGSLNFIFNNYTEEASFHDIVAQAKDEGYTEPDPKIDLSGIDVMRKILILARESGYELEIDDIKNESFLPDRCLKAKSIEDFFKTLTAEETHFKVLLKSALKADCKLKYVAQFEDGKAKVGLQHIEKEHPFYNLEGKDNIVLFYTDRYADQPLIIKGAGAGAEVTASGIFADIIRIGNF